MGNIRSHFGSDSFGLGPRAGRARRGKAQHSATRWSHTGKHAMVARQACSRPTRSPSSSSAFARTRRPSEVCPCKAPTSMWRAPMWSCRRSRRPPRDPRDHNMSSVDTIVRTIPVGDSNSSGAPEWVITIVVWLFSLVQTITYSGVFFLVVPRR